MSSTATASLPSIDLREVWQDHPGAFAEAVLPGAGFSFKYDGHSVGPRFSEEWRQSITEDSEPGATRTVWTHESGLVVTRVMRVLPDFGAIEYRVFFKNVAQNALAPLSAIHALDLSFENPVADGACVIASGGGMADGFLPPRSFAIRRHYLAPTLSDTGMADVLELGTEGGRSSNKDMPFFFVHNELRHEGLFVALGWSGQWAVLIQRDPSDGVLRISGKIPGLDIALEPGEEITGPTIVVGLYQGSSAVGTNRLRRLIREVYTPKLAGDPFLPVATYDHIWNVGMGFDESLLKTLADGAAAIGQEYFLLDAGWYAGTVERYGFSPGVGNWYEVDKQKLPNGLKPVADYVRFKGLKFGLWFEPERVAPGSTLAKEHPEWILWDHSPEPETSFNAQINAGYGLLDLGRPEVQEWVREMMGHYIAQLDLKYIRYDMNIDPLPYWDANDKAGRRGITQLKHIQGLYAIIDGLRKKYPDTVLEGCASGGRRIDLETVRRFHTAWISDYTVDPSIVRFHLFGINYFLPGNNHYVQYVLPTPNQKEFQADDLGFQSMFGGAFGTGGRVDLWPEAMKDRARLHVQTWKKLRRYLVGDYYPLSCQPSDLQSWSGWQFHDPQDQSGFIQTFRTHTADAAHRFFVHGLDGKTRYRFADAYSAEEFDMSGAEAMKTGIEVTHAPMNSKVLTYRKVSK